MPTIERQSRVLTKKQMAKQAIINAVEVSNAYEALALSVVLQAINDSNVKNNNNSIRDIRAGGLAMWLTGIKLNYSFLAKILKRYKLGEIL